MINEKSHRKKTNDIWIILFLICGFLFIGLYIFLKIVDPKASSEVLIFLFAGMIILPVIAVGIGAILKRDDSAKID